ncbi:hypothetical protein IQ249_10495 [Lusitaniella coriacea LEGE 07157]|uniref:Uncharacterized protein n=1 Tax=Lusitaniella coriacea LEGE 07157 TaxID=945747 RepID=A0A8J7DWA8_9CYAN|nr:hypothetical protein [Lusitaniella coriacea]MBE9116326.1 hypothetical protein [Lusitaniella coriacea LEGE 07157]
MTYTTKELIQILDRELCASWKGERVLLSANERFQDPVLSMALGQDKISKVYAYREFREQVHQYQRTHQVSGLVWREFQFQGKSLRFPELHNQLVAVPTDKEVLRAAKGSVLAFWQQATQGMQFWLVGKQLVRITAEEIARLAKGTEWAEVEAAQNELYLGLCWGNPAECHYQRAYPDSGCDRAIAAKTEPRSLKLIGSW